VFKHRKLQFGTFKGKHTTIIIKIKFFTCDLCGSTPQINKTNYLK